MGPSGLEADADGPGGTLSEFEISDAFGLTPLQQYLVPFPGGRRRALGIAWDATAGPGSLCVDCHAPQQTYMVVDPRRDHSFRIPRPDLSARLGTPDACTSCHAGKDAAWAAAAVERWYGPGRRREPHPGEAIHAGRKGAPGAALKLAALKLAALKLAALKLAALKLAALAVDAGAPAIFRATAVSLLSRYPGRAAFESWGAALGDEDPLVRHSALRAFEELPASRSSPMIAPSCADPVKAVRLAAARRLVAAGESLPGEEAAACSAALLEWESMQERLGGQPEALVSLGSLRAEEGRELEAREAYEASLRLDPDFLPAAVNLADLLSRGGDESAAERALRTALARAPRDGVLRHALGLSLVRQERKAEGLLELERAA